VSERDLKGAARKLDSYVENEFGQSLGNTGHLGAHEDAAGKEVSGSLSRGRDWLGDLDSNQDSQIQNLESYRWTISQQSENSGLTSYRDC
jgi:hypothetical protein